MKAPVIRSGGRQTAAFLFLAVSKLLWSPRRFRANELRVSVADCGSPLPLCVALLPVKKRQRAAAVQNLAESSSRLSGAATVFVKPPWIYGTRCGFFIYIFVAARQLSAENRMTSFLKNAARSAGTLPQCAVKSWTARGLEVCGPHSAYHGAAGPVSRTHSIPKR